MVYNGKEIIFRKLRESRQGVCPPEGPSLLNVLILLSLCYLFSQDSNINLTWLNYATYCSLYRTLSASGWVPCFGDRDLKGISNSTVIGKISN